MVEIRSLTPAELDDIGLFEAGFSSDRYVDIEVTGDEPDISIRMETRHLRQPIRRRLDGGTVEELVALYGPVESLRFMAAFHDGAGRKTDERQPPLGLMTWKYEDWNRLTWLCDIRVHPDHVRTGVGARLLEELKWAATRLDARGIMLETQTTNYAAIGFYLAQGFELAGFNGFLYRNVMGDPTEAALFFFLPLE